MRVHLGSDHAGLELKAHLVGWLEEHGHQVIDHGTYEYDDGDDYPPFCFRTGLAVVADPGSLGVVIGGSGNGEQMAANKVAGIRAALAWSEETAKLARLHNNANVVALGARMHDVDEATALVEIFLDTDFTGEQRHVRRIAMLTDYEESGVIPEVPVADLGSSGGSAV
ncbi:MAG TPA: ribose-5-phosphate isomerase [Nocardioidaceae bacterium]|jgi:ribose 5-phosphate isomerase B